MVSAIVIIAKRQPQLTYVVKIEDWLNPNMDVIKAQDLGKRVIQKADYKVAWILDENGEAIFFERR